ncbi:hypothetical protein ACOSP7_026137 [Xanthoceras sorbifolium]|uniref:RING-type E3 ubiquitin transferase n=1 Tax=Xanthoceras sorbifolium TaxID=99658 RepID=A0ABQ8HE16_9ROSI|nr:hypothetical protein JRO89_XS11G0003900 [Xanthoceras sorbifolium]
MEDEQPLNSNANNSNPMWRHSVISTTLSSLPLTRHSSAAAAAGDPTEGENCGSSDSSELYSKPVVFLDVMWNLAFVVVSVVVMLLALKETPSTPLRVWVSGYALQCLLHVGIVWFQYRTNTDFFADGDRVAANELSLSQTQRHSRIVKRLEFINTIVSSIWWVMGFYWIVVGGQSLLQDSPRLYWLTVVFLAFDVFFIIFCIVMACSFFLAIFCLIPVIAIAYAVATRKGASEDDIRSLPKYRYRLASPLRTMNNDEKQDAFGTGLESGSSNSSNELALYLEDSDCCICLSSYVEGAELYTLPCNHHFHCGCISKWLRINATCPLCKFNIHRCDTLV